MKTTIEEMNSVRHGPTFAYIASGTINGKTFTAFLGASLYGSQYGTRWKAQGNLTQGERISIGRACEKYWTNNIREIAKRNSVNHG